VEFIECNGARLPRIGFGTSGLSGGACTRMVRAALDLGYRHIDTAQAYGNETAVGAALTETTIDRRDIFLATKVWRSEMRDGALQRSVAESLRRLKTDYVDLLLIHWPNESVPMGETLDALAAVRAAGKARFIGVCNFTTRHLAEAVATRGADLLCDQVECHAMMRQERLRAALARDGMVLTAYSPLGRGRLTGQPALAAIGRKHGKSASQVALRWLMQQDGVIAIPKAGSEAHARANLEIFDFALDGDDLAAIDRLPAHERVIDPGWGPAWDD
jgi:2,5-diketo-D-gluconate reductase B